MKNIVEYINESNTDKIPVKAKNIGKKLLDDIYGGDFNELYDACENGNKQLVYSICNDINRNYSKPVFRSSDIKYIIDNWDLCIKAYHNYYDEKSR